MMQIANALEVPPTFFFDGAPTAARIGANKQRPIQDVADFVASKDGNALMKVFVKLTKEIQHGIVHLVAKIAEHK
jgi:CHASE3 domain sensor protein